MDTAIQSEQALRPLAQQPRQVHTITDRFSMANTYLINGERMIVVDPGSGLNVRLLLEYLSNFLHRPASDIDLIVLTHLHPDHSGGVEALRQASAARVAASIGALRLVESWQDEEHQFILPTESGGSCRSLARAGQDVSQTAHLPGALHHLDLFASHYEQQVRMVDLWLEDVAGLPNHLDWRVIASPGHTAESLCLYNPFSYELLCGDTVVTLEGGSTLVQAGSNRRQLEETLQTLRSLKVHYLYPGHGRPILSSHATASIHVEW